MSSPNEHRPALSFTREELVLLSITMLWGTTFLIVHLAMRHCGPLFFVGLRFVVAGGMALLFFHRAMRGLTRAELFAGAAIGLSILLGYALQTHELRTISASQSAFITAMYVPLVPLVQWAVLRRRPRLMSWIGIALAFIGLMLLTAPEAGSLELSEGAVATLASALAIAGEILLIGHFAPRVDSARVTVVQLMSAGLFSFAAMPLFGEDLPGFSWVWLAAGVGLGLASAVIQLAMNWAQKSVSPTRATVIYAGEPVWAGVFGRIAGERLPALAWLGAAFILAGVLASELKLPNRKRDG